MRSSDPTRRPAGSGSLRERRPGVWEVRIRSTAGPDGHRSRQRSVTVRGAEADAHAELVRLTAARPETVALTPPSLITVAEVLARWLAADHPWKPSTVVGYRSVVGFLTADPIARVRAEQVLPAVVRAAASRWEGDGASAAVIGGRFRALRAALSWAYDERLLDVHPIRDMRGPGRVPPRRPLAEAEVRALLLTAELLVLEAEANHPRSTGRGGAQLAHLLARAEQDLLLVRLAADTGARRGELAALQLADLDGRVLRIDKAVSAGVLTTPKSGHGRTLTLGATTAELWHTLHGRWTDRDRSPVGPWLFSARLDHAVPLTAGAPGAPVRQDPRRRRGAGRDPAPASTQRRHLPRRPRADPPGPSQTGPRRRRHHTPRVRLRPAAHRRDRGGRPRRPPQPTTRRTGTLQRPPAANP